MTAMTLEAPDLPAGAALEIWEPHPVYPHEGSSWGRIRKPNGEIVAQRPHSGPRDMPRDERYRRSTLWIPGIDGAKGEQVTVMVGQFITECHWGLKTDPRHEARHGRGPRTDNSWANLLGWGPPELNNGPDKPKEVRVAAARKARAAQLAHMESRKRPVSPPPVPRGWLRTVIITLRGRNRPPITAGQAHLSRSVSQR